jgi:hypothetical protein
MVLHSGLLFASFDAHILPDPDMVKTCGGAYDRKLYTVSRT